jgi:hypothetical protein
MVNIIGWIVIGLVVAFSLWRIVTARYRIRREMQEREESERLYKKDVK